MHHVAGMQCARRLAHFDHQAHGILRAKMTLLLDDAFQGFTGHVVVHRDETVGKLVRCHHMRQASALAFRQSGPYPATRQFSRYFLTNERSRSVKEDQLGYATGTVGKHAAHLVRIIEMERMQNLVVVHGFLFLECNRRLRRLAQGAKRHAAEQLLFKHCNLASTARASVGN